MPVIYPEPGKGPELARVLLSMVDHPREVKAVNEGGLGFEVSRELEQLWLDSLRPPEPEPEPAPEPEPVVDEPKKNRKKE
jgi:hypothetical protein